MMNKKTLFENHQKKYTWRKIIFIIALIVCLMLLIWYKTPYMISTENTLKRFVSGETELYGDTVYVKLNVRVQRNLFSTPEYFGTVTVNGDEYSDQAANANRSFAFSPFFVFRDHSSFTFACREWHGAKLLTRLVAIIENENVTNLILQDVAGNSAGEYCE